jgi:hypothetical protein
VTLPATFLRELGLMLQRIADELATESSQKRGAK